MHDRRITKKSISFGRSVSLRNAGICFACLAAIAGSSVVSGQDSQSDQPVRLQANLVVLDVDVLGKKTRLAIPGLGKDDFTLYEDGVKQHISYFSRDTLELSVVILLDVSSSIAPNFGKLQSAAAMALTRLKGDDEVALIVFGGSARVIQAFTKQKRLVSDAILEADGTGLARGTDVNEGIYLAATYLDKNSSAASRRVIIGITDDTTSLNIVTPRADSSTLRKLHETRSVVCGLIFNNPYRRYVIGNTASVRTYADVTGGIAVSAESKKLDANLSQLIDHLRSQYSLGYSSSNQKRDGSFRKIKLEITSDAQRRIGDAIVTTRKGYYDVRAGDDGPPKPRL